MKARKFIPWDDEAHVFVSQVVDSAEEKRVANGDCVPEAANDCVALELIASCAGMVRGASLYTPNDERIGSDLFLWKNTRGRHRTAMNRYGSRYATQLALHSHRYFPHYNSLLRQSLLEVLSRIDDPRELHLNGIVLLSCRKLEGVVVDIRRELRRRGMQSVPLLIRSDELPNVDSFILNQYLT